MKIMGKLSKLILIIITFLVFSGCSKETLRKGNHADWLESYESVEEMAVASDVIVLAEVAKQTMQTRIDMVFTMSEMTILEIYKQNVLPDSKIVVLQTGGKFADLVTAPIEGVLMLQESKTYLLFLRKSEEGHYLVMGGFQGAATVINQAIYFPDNSAFDDNPINALKIDEFESALSEILQSSNE